MTAFCPSCRAEYRYRHPVGPHRPQGPRVNTFMSDRRIQGVKTWSVVKADHKGRISIGVTPGWYRRSNTPDGVISLIPIGGWKLVKHRLLWGFRGLVDARLPNEVAATNLADGLAAALWRHAGRLAGGAW